jgi:hypothetical protein
MYANPQKAGKQEPTGQGKTLNEMFGRKGVGNANSNWGTNPSGMSQQSSRRSLGRTEKSRSRRGWWIIWETQVMLIISLLFLLAVFALQTNGKVLGALEDLLHALVDQLLLLDKFLGLGVLPELDGLDQAVLEFLWETVGGLHFDVGVPDADQVC